MGVSFIFNLSKSSNYMSLEDSLLDNADKSILFLFAVLINLKLSVSGTDLNKMYRTLCWFVIDFGYKKEQKQIALELWKKSY